MRTWNLKPAPAKIDPLDRVFADPKSGQSVIAGIFLGSVWAITLLDLTPPWIPIWRTNGGSK